MLTHQVVAIGDIHLQSTHPRNGARLAALDQIIREGLALPRLALWAQLGDVFHGRSTPADRNALADRILAMAAYAPVCIVQGNHEAPGDLDILEDLRGEHPIVVATSPQVRFVRAPDASVLAVAMLPYPQKAGLIAGDVTADATLQTGQQALDAIVRGLAAELADHAQHAPIFLAHVNVAGSIASNGQPQIGREMELTPATLGLLPVHCPKILGHIHKPQMIAGAYYVGSVARLDWGEVEEKRYLVIDPGWRRGRPSSRHDQIQVAPMFHVEGALTREGFQLGEEAGHGEVYRRFIESDWRGCEVRLRYSFLASEKAALEGAAVEMVTAFSTADHLAIEPVAVPDRALRAPEVATAKTLREKVEAWARLNGQALPDALGEKLARLETEDPAHLLSVVANGLAAIERATAREEVHRAA